jgi:hypothetical protein
MPTIRAKQGYTNCYFRKIIVPAGGAFASLTFPDVAINVSGLNNFSLSNETNTSVVEVSFNGVDVHDELDSALTTKFLDYSGRCPGSIWFRMKTGGPATVCVRCW